MGNFVDLTNKVFGNWTVLNRAEGFSKPTRWNCRCSCGQIKTVRVNDLVHEKSKSCGECPRTSQIVDGVVFFFDVCRL